MRDLYWTFRNFRNRVADFLRYRRVTANMDERFPDATPEELQRADHTCIVCRCALWSSLPILSLFVSFRTPRSGSCSALTTPASSASVAREYLLEWPLSVQILAASCLTRSSAWYTSQPISRVAV